MMTPRGLLKTFVKRLRQVAKRATVVIAAITLPQICAAEGAFVSVGSGSAGRGLLQGVEVPLRSGEPRTIGARGLVFTGGDTGLRLQSSAPQDG